MPNALQRTAQRIVRGLFGVTFGTPGADTWEFARDWTRGIYTDSDGGLTRPFEQVGPYCRAVSVIARDAAAVPWEFFVVNATGEREEDTDEPVPNHPVSRVWQRPNADMLGNQFMVGSYLSKLCFGEWIWYYPDLKLGRNGGLRATQQPQGELNLLHPPSVLRKLDERGEIVYSLRDKKGREQVLDRRYLTISKRYNPHDPLRGLSLAASIMADMHGYKAAAEWNARFFDEQNGVPTILLKPSVGSLLSDATAAGRDQRREILRSWNERHGGRRRGAGVLPAGWDAKDFGTTQRDMDFAELRQFGRDEILAAAGVPPLIAGYLTRPITYNASEQKQVYWESTINNFVLEEQAVINFDFLPKMGVVERVWPKWEVVQALLENLLEKTEIAARWFAMGLSKRVINERLEMGWNEDDIPDYEVGYLPFSVVPQEMVNAPPEPVAAPAPQEEQPPKGYEVIEAPWLRKRGVSLAGATEERRALVWRNIVNRTRDIESSFNKTIRRHFVEIRDEVMLNLDGMKGWQVIHARNKVLLTSMFDVDAAKRKLQKLTQPLHKRAVVRGAEALLAEVSVQIAFDLESSRVLAALAELSHKITRIDDTVDRLLASSLSEGFDAKETLEQLRDRVSVVMDASLGRSLTIARTETGFAYNGGRFEAMQQAGIKFQEWLSSRDPDVRETHQIDGEQVLVGEPFSNGLLYPQDPNGPPEEVINCRCTPIAVSA